MLNGCLSDIGLPLHLMLGANDVDLLADAECATVDSANGNELLSLYAPFEGASGDVVETSAEGLHLGYIYTCWNAWVCETLITL